MRFDNKRGNMVGAVMAFVLVVVVIFAYVNINMWGNTVLDEIDVEITVAHGYTNESVQLINNMQATYSSLNDSIAMFILVGLWILAMILAFNSSSHPFLAFLTIILVVIISLVGMILANTWDDIANDPTNVGVASDFPMTNFVLTNYLTFVIVIGMSVVLMIFWGARQ